MAQFLLNQTGKIIGPKLSVRFILRKFYVIIMTKLSRKDLNGWICHKP